MWCANESTGGKGVPEWRRQRGGREAGSAKRLSVTTPPPPAVEIPVLPNRPEVVYRYRAEAAAVAKATLRAAASAACSLKHAQSSLFCDCSYRFQSYRLVPLRIALSLKAKMVGDLPARQTGSVIVVGCWCEKVQGCVSPRVPCEGVPCHWLLYGRTSRCWALGEGILPVTPAGNRSST